MRGALTSASTRFRTVSWSRFVGTSPGAHPTRVMPVMPPRLSLPEATPPPCVPPPPAVPPPLPAPAPRLPPARSDAPTPAAAPASVEAPAAALAPAPVPVPEPVTGLDMEAAEPPAPASFDVVAAHVRDGAASAHPSGRPRLRGGRHHTLPQTHQVRHGHTTTARPLTCGRGSGMGWPRPEPPGADHEASPGRLLAPSSAAAWTR